MSDRPRVSIGVPVYNGQRYVRATLDSLVAQTYRDLEIVISDNASTDATESICREYADRDPRVKYHRASVTVGPAQNFNRTVEFATGHYFKWNAADDVCAPDFVEKCVAVLDANPDVTIAYPKTKQIDTDGKVVAEYDYEMDYSSNSPANRLWHLLFVSHRIHGAHELYGVMRFDALKQTGLFGAFVRADSIILARLVLLGRFHRINEFLFFNRDHNDRSAKQLGKKSVRPNSWLSKYIGCGPLPSAEWWDRSLKGKIVFPEWRVLQEYLRAVHQTPLSLGQKLACYSTMSVFALRHIPKLGRDLIIATEQALTLFLKRFSRQPLPSNERKLA